MDALSIELKWNLVYEKDGPSAVSAGLFDNAFLLPETGVSLDLACGLGENAMFLAERGLTSHAWDISSVALNKLQKNAKRKNLTVFAKKVYIESNMLPINTFDVIVLSHFLDRSLSNAIIESLKPNGLLFYQTYVREKITTSGPKNIKFLLARNEMLALFGSLKVVVYRENSLIGNLDCGERNTALFVGQKC